MLWAHVNHALSRRRRWWWWRWLGLSLIEPYSFSITATLRGAKSCFAKGTNAFCFVQGGNRGRSRTPCTDLHHDKYLWIVCAEKCPPHAFCQAVLDDGRAMVSAVDAFRWILHRGLSASCKCSQTFQTTPGLKLSSADTSEPRAGALAPYSH